MKHMVVWSSTPVVYDIAKAWLPATGATQKWRKFDTREEAERFASKVPPKYRPMIIGPHETRYYHR